MGFGGLYVRSTKASKLLQNQLNAELSPAPKGTAFLRWPYRAKNPAQHKSVATVAVLIAGVGRFGNSVLQVLNSYRIASILGSTTVYYFHYSAIKNRATALTGGIEMIRFSLNLPSRPRAPRVIWKTHAMVGQKVLVDPCSGPSQVISQNLQAAVLPGYKKGKTRESVLTIHLRSGDIFWDSPHNSYGQPPFAYYKQILESRNWALVEIVSEDSSNPCHELITTWCKQAGVRARALGEDFETALTSLARAQHLVAGSGTFVPAITYLFPLQRNVYTFEYSKSELYCAENVIVFTIRDRLGTYTREILSNNWRNLPWQRQLMADYPDDALGPLESIK